jgi:hypothetical protein
MEFIEVREGNCKRRHGGTRWKLEVGGASFSFPGALKTYIGKEELVIPTQ